MPLLKCNERMTTLSGHLTTPFPVIKKRHGKKVDEWLVLNALDDALSRNDVYNHMIISTLNPLKLTTGDKYYLNHYLFGELC